MIASIEARGYKCLKNVSQSLRTFQILVGPNASGKTTFLDVLAFMRDVLDAGPREAVALRTPNFADLTWARAGGGFELAVEAVLPGHLLAAMNGRGYQLIRYELSVESRPDYGDVGIVWENVMLLPRSLRAVTPRTLFPDSWTADSILMRRTPRGARTVVRKVPERNDNFYSEVHSESGKGWMPSFRLGPYKSSLANLPDDETRFPAATWFRTLLREGVQSIVLNSAVMSRPSPPGQGRSFRPDGSNLPWVIVRLQEERPDRYRAWLEHLSTSLPDIAGIRIVERPEDRHRYLMIRYAHGVEVPSWGVSDGTLRLMALTLLAYLGEPGGIFLIEEPENGIHPRAVETMYQALSSVYDSQILVASHSPVLLANARLRDVLCFGRTKDGATDIVSGEEHPQLRDWHEASNPGLLLASGVL